MPRAVLLAAADPAQPYGAALPWPRPVGGERFRRSASPERGWCGGGAAAMYIERAGLGIIGLPAMEDADVAGAALGALPALLAPVGSLRELRIERIHRPPPGDSPWGPRLLELGFRAGYRGYLLRR